MNVEAGPELARAGKEPVVEVTSAWLEDRHCSLKWEESRLSGLVNTRWSDYIGGRAEHGPYPRRGGVSPQPALGRKSPSSRQVRKYGI